MSTTRTQKPLPRLPRREKPPRQHGPPKVLALLLILFVVVGGIVYGVWYMTRETPKVIANNLPVEAPLGKGR